MEATQTIYSTKTAFWINKTNNLSILLLINRRNRKNTFELILQEGYNRCKRVSFRMSAFIFVGQVIFFNRERCCKDARKSYTTNMLNCFLPPFERFVQSYINTCITYSFVFTRIAEWILIFSEQLIELNLDGIPSERQQSNSEYYYTSTHISLNQSLYFLAEL